ARDSGAVPARRGGAARNPRPQTRPPPPTQGQRCKETDPRPLPPLGGELARDEFTWRPLVRHDPHRRNYAEITRDDRVGIWVISWMDDHDTGFHDHDISSGAVAVVQGELREERLR